MSNLNMNDALNSLVTSLTELLTDTDNLASILTQVTNAAASQSQPYPVGAVPQTATSGNQAAATAVATLAHVTGHITYISGFEVTGSGAMAGLPVEVTVAGVISGTLTYIYSAAIGVLLENTPLIITFDPAIPASAINTDIVVTCPTLGTGNTNNVVNARGYTL